MTATQPPRMIAVLISLSGLVLTVAPLARAALPVRPVAMRGMTSPGTGGVISGVSASSWGIDGNAVFLEVSISGGTSTEGVFVERDGVLSPNLLRGDMVGSGTARGSVRFDGNSAGQTLSTTLVSGGVDDWALVLADDTPGADPIVHEEGPAPGSSLPFWGLQTPLINDAGGLAFEGWLGADSIDEKGIWSNAFTDDIVPVYISGEPAPGGGTFDDTGIRDPRLSNGVLGFTVRLDDVNGRSESAIFAHDTSGTRLVARSGDTAPGTEGGTYQSMSNAPQVTDDGKLIFDVSVLGGNTSKAVFIDHSDGLGPQLIYRRGDPAPGTTGELTNIFTISANDDAGMVFSGSYRDNTSAESMFAIWTDARTGELEMVAEEGDVIEGLEITSIFLNSHYAVSDSGRVAFTAVTRDFETQENLGDALFVMDLDGDVELVASEHRPLALSTGELVEFTVVDIHSEIFARNDKVFSDDTLVFYGLTQNNGNGIFAVTVPEPASLGRLALLSVMALSFVSRRKISRRNDERVGIC